MMNTQNKRKQAGDAAQRLWGRLRPLLLLALCLSAAWLMGVVPATHPATADGGATITLESAGTTINACETLDLYIRINDVTGLYGADVRLAFDPTVLEVTALQELGDFLKPPFYIALKQVDNSAGTVWLALTQLNPTPPVSGSGDFARVTFRAKGETAASPVEISYSKLADINGMEIPATAVDGSLSTTPPAPPVVSITKLSSTTAQLSWNAVAGIGGYNVYRDSYAYFTPAVVYYATSDLTFDDVGAIGDVAINYFYVVRSTCNNGFESAYSNRVGEFDYALVTP